MKLVFELLPCNKSALEAICKCETEVQRSVCIIRSGSPQAKRRINFETFEQFFVPQIGSYIIDNRDGMLLKYKTSDEAFSVARQIYVDMLVEISAATDD